MGIVFPGPGDDSTKANNVTGTAESDTMNGGAADDTLSGLGGNDQLTGNFDDDRVFGGDGNDLISGGEDGFDLVDGGDGNDVIFESNDFDTLSGGNGSDTITVRGISQADGGAGNDTLRLGAFDNINQGLAVHDGALLGGAGFDTLIIGGTVSFVATSFQARDLGFERIEPTLSFQGDDAANDLNFKGLALVGPKGLSLSGLGGDDRLTGLDSFLSMDVLQGNSGNDTLNGGKGNDELFGDAGDDELNGGAGDDRLFGALPGASLDTDELDGGGDNDTIAVRAEAIALGGADDDRLEVSNYTVRNIVAAGGSDSTASIDGDIVPFNLGEKDTLAIGENVVFATKLFSFFESHFELLEATAAIRADGFDNLLDFEGAVVVGTQPIVFFGGAGNDDIAGTTVQDRINGQTGHDSLFGSNGNDALNGNEDNDTLEGGLGFDTLDGGSGDDILDGGIGADKLIDTGGVIADGGAGNDFITFVFANVGKGNVEGGEGDDTIISRDSIFDQFEAEQQKIERAGGNFFGTDQGNVLDVDGVRRANGEALNVFGAGGNDRISASAAGVRLDGQGGNDFCQSQGFFNQLNGGDGNDTCSAGGAGSTVTGGDGNDTLNGAEGATTIDGGFGTDKASWHWVPDQPLPAPGVTVDLSRSTSQNTGYGNYAITRIENVDGSKLDDRLLGENGDNFLNGFAGSDLLRGGLGNDTLFGGLGRDTASYLASSSSVRVDLRLTGAQDTGQGLDVLRFLENVEGSSHADTLTGNNAANELLGGRGFDTLMGGLGSDVLIGGRGADRLVGSDGDDIYRLLQAFDSPAAIGLCDKVVGFRLGDKIDVSALSLDDFIGTEQFSAAGQIRVQQQGLHALLEFNLQGVAVAEAQLLLLNFVASKLTQGDIIIEP